MEKIGSIVNRVIKKTEKTTGIKKIFTPQEIIYVHDCFIRKKTLFVYLGNSSQIFEFKLREQLFLKKAQRYNLGITKVVFRIAQI